MLNIKTLGPLILLLAIGCRLVWPSDMEWKKDEQLMHVLSKDAVASGNLPEMGMRSGIGLDNAGFSIWPFAWFYQISLDPVNMAKCVMWVNVFALLLMWYCAGRSGPDSEVMRMGVLLFSVNVLAVLFSRKIWAQDLIPAFTALLWFCFIYRKYIGAIFAMGLLAALEGQLHMSGFFYAAGLFLGVLYLSEKRIQTTIFLALGFLAGMVPAADWLQHVLSGQSHSDASFSNILKFEFALHSLLDPLGINVVYSLGKSLGAFLPFPMVGSMGLFLPVLVALAIAGVFIFGIVRLIRHFPAREKFAQIKERPVLFFFVFMVIIPGVLLTFSGSPIRSHYLIGAAPFLHCGLAWLLHRAGKNAIWIMIFSQLAMTILFLLFVHQSTEIAGDYGVPYRVQKTINL